MNKNSKLFIVFSLLAIISISIVATTIYFLQSQTDKIKNKKNFSSVEIAKSETCLTCHSKIQGIEDSHSPDKIGCYSCHLGNPKAKSKEDAHQNMILIPGNFTDLDKTCGSPNCHPQMIPRMKNNIMNSMNGVVTVDKWVFDESASPTFKNSIEEIKFSPAEKHLRNLCASCHLSNVKTEIGPINELSRGGGCLACHLNYSEDALKELNYSKKQLTKFHPNISLQINNMHCFGCHSRSGRISLSYDGWHETLYKPEEIKSKIGFRVLDDGRVVQQIKKDVHSEKGLLCVDCHNSYEIMGDGNYYLHKEEQLQIQCVDCHLTQKPKTKKLNEFDFESKKIAELIGTANRKAEYLLSAKGNPFTNVIYENEKSFLIKKRTKQKIDIKKPSFACTEGFAHKDLSCTTCHNSWTPQCIGCHTEYDADSKMFDLLDNKEAEGEWLEHPQDLIAGITTLAVRESKNKREVIEVMPGMVLTIQKSRNEKPSFKRLFAPAFSHTIRKESKSCKDCHLNPLVLGYGRGKLDYEIKNGKGKFVFTPTYPNIKYDNLPQDAWTGFLKERKSNAATRENIRTFSVNEQKQILTVGSCLTCHEANSKVMKAALYDFDRAIKLKSNECVLPYWQ